MHYFFSVFFRQCFGKQRISLASDYSVGRKGFVLQFREESKRNHETDQTHKSLHKYLIKAYDVVEGGTSPLGSLAYSVTKPDASKTTKTSCHSTSSASQAAGQSIASHHWCWTVGGGLSTTQAPRGSSHSISPAGSGRRGSAAAVVHSCESVFNHFSLALRRLVAAVPPLDR